MIVGIMCSRNSFLYVLLNSGRAKHMMSKIRWKKSYTAREHINRWKLRITCKGRRRRRRWRKYTLV